MASEWEVSDFVSDKLDLDGRLARKLLELFEDDNSVPFIARYRKEQTNDMTPNDIRKAFCVWEEAKALKAKIQLAHRQIAKQGLMTEDLAAVLNGSRSLQELEALQTPFKPGKKTSLAERAKQLGLEPIVFQLLSGQPLTIKHLITDNVKGLETEQQIQEGLCHFMADFLFRKTETQKFIRQLISSERTYFQCSFSKQSKDITPEVRGKYQNYADFKTPVANMKSYQTLAISRGENEKVLTVKVVVPDGARLRYGRFLESHWLCQLHPSWRTFSARVTSDSYTRLAHPHICRCIRSGLWDAAELEAVDVFARNLKQLLLAPPIKDCPILGIDPGFKHGCKFAVISISGDVLETGYFNLNKPKIAEELLARLVRKHSSAKIAIGNGKGSRETEGLLSNCCKKKLFLPLDVQFCIVNEAGASVYSVSPLAENELPALDPNLRSAVSIARRLQDAMGELVKIQPESLGVGMYQHDLKKKLLRQSLNSVVQECVSFVGVDLNTCSQQILQHVSGLNASRAANIIKYRGQVGRFRCRQQLLEVNGIGEKTFQQCAGFLRIYLSSWQDLDDEDGEIGEEASGSGKRKLKGTKASSRKRKRFHQNPLDSTSVHPESYQVAISLLKTAGLSVEDLHSCKCATALEDLETKDVFASWSEAAGVGKQLLLALRQPLRYDCRTEWSGPVFRSGVGRLEEVRSGERLRGCVRNLTAWGAFLDVGVGCDGLIHVSALPKTRQLEVGDNLLVVVRSVDMARRRMQLEPADI